MITLKPPFQAEDMQGLFKAVLKGQYNKLPPNYSKDLNTMIEMMLDTTAAKRPTTLELM
jgi:NIMA (never in mitosis gene a)-related kinase